MLIRSADLEAIRAGLVDTAFRRWTRPTVKAGGTLMTAIGVLAIDAVEPIELAAVSDEDARRAGFSDAAALGEWLDASKPGQLYRIRLRHLGADPRIAMREATDGLDEVELALAKLDAKAPWIDAVLEQIEANPGTLAQVLADRLGMEKLKFKGKVRQLKALGLTESLDIGYRLSPRGKALLARRRGTTASA